MVISFASLAFKEEKEGNERKWKHWGLGVDKKELTVKSDILGGC